MVAWEAVNLFKRAVRKAGMVPASEQLLHKAPSCAATWTVPTHHYRTGVTSVSEFGGRTTATIPPCSS